MNNSLNIRLVIRLGLPYTTVSHHLIRQCSFLNIKTGPLSTASSSPVLGLITPKSIGTMSNLGLVANYSQHFLEFGHFRSGIGLDIGLGLAPCKHLTSSVKSFHLGLGTLSSGDNVSEGRPRPTILPQEQVNTKVELGLGTPAGSLPDNSVDPNALLDINAITDGDPVLERKLNILFLEVDVWRQEGVRVPSQSYMKNEVWKDLLNASSRSARLKYLSFLWTCEIKKLKKKNKKDSSIRPHEDLGVHAINEDNGHIQYGLRRNTMFMRIYDTTINQHYNNKVIQAIQFGQKIVIDCGYDSHLTSHESKTLAKQITQAFSDNRLHDDPFDIYLCNANRKSRTLGHLNNLIKTLYEDSFPLNVTNESYLDLFPKKDIVYLTPHCREELTSFNHNSVYVIGGIVDKSNQGPLSLAVAKKEGLQMAKLPLDRYVNWGSGSGKSLNINHMVQIMLEIKTSGNWAKALEHVPRRKLYHDEPRERRSQFKSRSRERE